MPSWYNYFLPLPPPPVFPSRRVASSRSLFWPLTGSGRSRLSLKEHSIWRHQAIFWFLTYDTYLIGKKKKRWALSYSRKAIDAPGASSTAGRVAVMIWSPILLLQCSFYLNVCPQVQSMYVCVSLSRTHRPRVSTWHPHFSAAVTHRAVLTALRNANRIKGCITT